MLDIHRYMRRDRDEDILGVMPKAADAASTRAGSATPLEDADGNICERAVQGIGIDLARSPEAASADGHRRKDHQKSQEMSAIKQSTKKSK